MKRRSFLQGAVLSAFATRALAAPGEGGGMGPEASLPRTTAPGSLEGEMLCRTLGRTGAKVSAIGFGGSHFAKKGIAEVESIGLVHAAVDRGITFMDNCWDYNDGQSEIRMGKALAKEGYRNKVFLMTKFDGRTKEEAQKQIDASLKRLKTDHLDLLMHHEILRFDDPDRIFDEGGAHEALQASQKAGKVRFAGFTGHKDPRVHLSMLDAAKAHGVTFDAVLMPINVMDAHFRSFAQLVLPRLVREGVGVLSMKPFGGADGIILKSKTVEPLECLHYAMSLPTNVVITGIDRPAILEQALQAAKTFKPMDEAALGALLARTKEAAQNGHYELFKTSSHFDGTAKHAEWLGKDSPRVKGLAPPNAG